MSRKKRKMNRVKPYRSIPKNEIVSCNLTPRTVKVLDHLSSGLGYPSRSDFIRKSIHFYIEQLIRELHAQIKEKKNDEKIKRLS